MKTLQASGLKWERDENGWHLRKTPWGARRTEAGRDWKEGKFLLRTSQLFKPERVSHHAGVA